ncbi:hypothetical protein PM082_021151 [Marasmius tenuissimus]|nr:hypothetical protein PM082_021151 [Marasmius tenuissimus]
MIVLDKVKTLSMKRLGPDVSLIEHFTFPRLQTVDIESSAINLTHLEPFIQRSSRSITSLRLDSIPNLSDSHFIHLLHLMPELKKLDVGEDTTNKVVTRRFLDLLTVKPDDFHSPFLPRLVDLKLNIHAMHVEVQALSNALTFRWLPIPSVASAVGTDCLKSVDITLCWGQGSVRNPTVLSSLQCLKSAGMQLTITHA